MREYRKTHKHKAPKKTKKFIAGRKKIDSNLKLKNLESRENSIQNNTFKKRWCSIEELNLLQFLEDGMTCAEISPLLNRSIMSIRNKARRLL